MSLLGQRNLPGPNSYNLGVGMSPRRVSFDLLSYLANADTRKQFNNRGFLLLGFFLAAGLSMVHIAEPNLLYTPIPLKLQTWLDIILSVVGTGVGSALKFPLIETIVVIYLIVASIEKYRLKAGQYFVDLLLVGARVLIRLAEICLARRGLSTLTFLALIVILPALMFRYYSILEAKTRHDAWLKSWLNRSSVLIADGPLDGSDVARTEELVHAWNREHPNQVDEDLEGSGLLQSFNLILQYAAPKSPWLVHVRNVLPQITALRANLGCEINFKECALLDLLIAKLEIRSVGDPCTLAPALSNAHKRLLGISEPSLIKAASNARGNVLNCTLASMLQDEAVPLEGYGICDGPYDCLEKAVGAYEEGREGAELCSFEDKRFKNNLIDIKVDIALNIDGPSVEKLVRGQFREWTRTPTALADKIIFETQDLLRCSYRDPNLAIFFLTSAQAYGVAVSLMGESGNDNVNYARAAGTYLRLALGYRPNDLEDWNLRPFCGLMNENYKNDFYLGFAGPRGLAEVEEDYLTSRILKICRNG
jgi:hypothetical protein